MKKIGFVILHYYTENDTSKCIKSIREKLEDKEIEIIVVDNGSTNFSGTKLKNKYKKDAKIHFIFNKENKGFARGNNVGFEYAKKILKCDCIILLNNDTCILQKDFLEKIREEYKNSNFAVLGPKIKLLNKKINIVNNNKLTIDKIKKELRSDILNLFFSYIGLYYIYSKFKKHIKNLLNRNYNNKHNYTDPNIRYENIILHGCFLIFSPVYINKFDGLDDRTFLYHEEEILFNRLQKNKMLSVYNPELEIFHAEDSSTNAVNSNDRKKRIFIYKNKIKSGRIIYNDLKKG